MKIIRAKNAAELLGISLATLYRWQNKGFLPPKVKYPSGSVGYRSDDIEAFIEEHTEIKAEAEK